MTCRSVTVIPIRAAAARKKDAPSPIELPELPRQRSEDLWACFLRTT